ncbi:hypothetical protein EX895_004454 [Sporisorium graminicola]|uniref:Transcriptional regulatory protein RXT2 N-terminal domain-containing protein n=1 Tax=Sporisorium graminicola TaxID=280036 RepID=A0A4U7KR61_9BASI|nr:hypothetical protein EX895_004454 [Sporisorium graminicola]TKY86813.1 hypothetical protein EX895_004454 [Sporisorium graminicola]
MSQPGSTEPVTASHLVSTSAPNDKPTLAPPIAPSDDEAEEGEIFDEEEGEIPESLAAEPAVFHAAPTQPASSAVAEPAPDAPKHPSTSEFPASDAVEEDDKQQDSSTSQSAAEALHSVPIQASAETSLPVESTEPASEPSQAPPQFMSASTFEEKSPKEAVQDSVAELTILDVAAPAALKEAVTQSQEHAEENPTSKESEDPSTPKLPGADAPKPEAPTPATATVEEQSHDYAVDKTTQSIGDAQMVTEVPSTAGAQLTGGASEPAPAETLSQADELSDMDVDEKVAVPAHPASEESEKSADAALEPMQVDDSVHTPAVHTPAPPSDGPEVPAAAEPVIETAAEEHQEEEATAHDSAPSPPPVKSEPHAEAGEPSQSKAAQVSETAPSEPVEIAQPEPEKQPHKEESNRADFGPRAETTNEQEMPSEARRRSTTPRFAAVAFFSDASKPEEVQRHATVERDDPSASRTSEAERARSRAANRGSAAPSTGQERRLERERTKDRSHPPEHSQDREQRAREKDRRRELERLERERERERERIRDSERDREMMIARENEEARLIWLSLPGNDHPQYYTDTDSDSCYGVGGALGVDLTDEEDKDLNPPYPLSLQEYHPAPSYSQSYYDDSYYSSKRKRIDDAIEIDFAGSSRRNRRKPMSKPSDVDRPAPSSSVSVQRLPSTVMIDIDDFPVPDSSIRSEPSDRPFASRLDRTSLPRISPYNRSEEADEDFESSDSDEEAMRIAEERKRRHGNRGGNRGNKLSRDKGARWVRRGKLGGWTEMRMEKEIGDRVRHRVEAMQKDNVRALLSAMPEEDKAMLAQFPALRNGLIPSEAPSNARRDARGRLLASDVSEAARIDAELGLDGAAIGSSGTEHLTSTSLAPTLLKPAITPRQLLTSHTLRHTFRNPHIAALGKTALDLIESEGVVGRAVGRCWAAMERGGWNEDPEPKGDEVEEVDDSHHQNGVNGMDIDGSDAEGSTRHRGEDGGANGASTSVFGSAIDNPALSHLDRLFVTKQGLAIPRLDDMGQPIFVPPSPATQVARAQAGLADEEASEPVIETTLLPAPEQRSIVLAALECLHDLAADSREYVDRLEEVRSRLAAVKRRRAQVWNAVRQWALDKDVEASLVNGARPDQNGAPKSIVEAAAAAASTLSTAASTANGTSPKKRK